MSSPHKRSQLSEERDTLSFLPDLHTLDSYLLPTKHTHIRLSKRPFPNKLTLIDLQHGLCSNFWRGALSFLDFAGLVLCLELEGLETDVA